MFIGWGITGKESKYIIGFCGDMNIFFNGEGSIRSISPCEKKDEDQNHWGCVCFFIFFDDDECVSAAFRMPFAVMKADRWIRILKTFAGVAKESLHCR